MSESVLGRSRDVDRLAIIVSGDGDVDAPALATTLLAASERWSVLRIEPPLTRLTVKQAFDGLPPRLAAAVVVLAAPVIEVAGVPALVVGADPATYPDDATVALPWLAERLAAAGARGLVVVLARAARPAAALAVLATALPGALLVAGEVGSPSVATLAVGLSGLASDPTTGTVTLASLGHFVRARLPTAAVASVDDRSAFISPGTFELLRSRRIDAPPAAVTAAPATVGTVLPGRFRLDAELARGTFGTVYRARQLAVERDVAIKLLHGEIDPTSPDGHLFLQEIRSVGRLDHRNVVRIYQADVAHDGRLFYAMELLPGRTLMEVAAAAPLALPRAVGLVTQVLAGLGAAHEAGLIHADVKPANVIVVPSQDGERAVLVDFGLARLRAAEPAASAGGTPAFMAPEQLRDGRVDARSDLFAAALVLVNLATGWRRRKASELVPPLEAIAEPRVRAALTRALAIDPAARFASAAEFAAALTGAATTVEPAPAPPPFHGLSSFTERDAERLRGRDRELAALIDLALFRAVVVVTAPSGTGKTSLLRAGLVPALARYGSEAVYVSGREAPVVTALAQLAPTAASLTAAITARPASSPRLVVIVDQLEALLGDDGAEQLTQLLALASLGRSDVGLVLSVREDFLARVLTRPELARVAAPTLRIGPMDLDGARAAIVDPLAARHVAVAPPLLAVLLADLAAAGAALAPELGWGAEPAVYPPHLQLVGAVLYQALAADEATITLDHYQRLGGFDAIVGEHLERVLETELDGAGAAIARELFLALVTSTHARAARTEAELLTIVNGRAGALLAVLEILRRQGLLVRAQRAVGEPIWELVHDSLVPRVLSWIDRQDLARRRAMEQVRYHLRRSRGGAMSLLSRAELRELDAHAGALAELEAEQRRRDGSGLGPAALVARSRRIARRTTLATILLAATVTGIVGFAGYDRYRANAVAARERAIRDRDLGRFTLELRPFDWDPSDLTPREVDANQLPMLRWTLRTPDPDDPERPGAVIPPSRFRAEWSTTPGHFTVEAPGGAAYLVVSNRQRTGEPPCADSIVPLKALPGAAQRGRHKTITVVVPSCRATYTDMEPIPAGDFMEGGAGEPLSVVQLANGRWFSRRTFLPAFKIDRTEVSNAAYARFAAMASVTGFAMPIYPTNRELEAAGRGDFPVSGISWHEASAYCRWLGKSLPSSQEWQKASRGGIVLRDGAPNLHPRRNAPWWPPKDVSKANINAGGVTGPTSIRETERDVGPYDVIGQAGNVQEWTNSSRTATDAIARGGDWQNTTPANLNDYLAIENERPKRSVDFALGFRCALR